MKRRDFVGLIAGAAIWPVAARGQPKGKRPIIGLLAPTAPAPGWLAAFQERLRQLGWTEGQDVTIEYRWAEGRPERLAEFAAEFIRLKVDVIVTGGTPVVLAMKRATTEIPIVFTSAGDPVGTGLVASLARPGGNITGLSFMTTDAVGKRLGLFREVMPALKRLGVMANVAFPDGMLERGEVEAIGRTLGLEVFLVDIRRPDDIESAFEVMKGVEGVYVCGDPLMLNSRVRLNGLAQAARLPTMHSLREQAEAGGLMSYGPNFPDLFRRTADLVSKILHGTKPTDIPVEQPTRFDLVINLKTAKALGLDVPSPLLGRADTVIE